MIKEKIKLIKSGKLSAVDNVKSFLGKIERDNKKGRVNAVLVVNKKAIDDDFIIAEKGSWKNV